MGNNITSNQASSTELRCIIESLNSKLENLVKEHHVAVENFVKDYHMWLQKRKAVISILSSLQESVEKHNRNVNIASLTGSSVSLVSGAAFMAGIALAPLTGGLSVALTAGGLLGSTAGSLTAVAARITDFGLTKTALDRAHAVVEDDCQETVHLSSLIEVCVQRQTEIQDFVMSDACLSLIRKNESLFAKLLVNPRLKERVQRIREGTATVDDVLLILSLLYSGDILFLKKANSLELIASIELKLMEGTLRAAATLRSSIGNVRKCATLLKNWRAGLSSIGLATKTSRLAKGAMVGLSMAVDVYEISSTAKQMISGQKTDASKSLQALIEELVKQTNDICSYYHSLDT